jgi:hypothetical protein
MTLPFIFYSLVSNSRRVPDRSTRNNRLARLVRRKRVPNVKIGAKARRFYRRGALETFAQKPNRSTVFSKTFGDACARRLKSRAERRSFDVGLRSSARALRQKRKTRADKAKNTVL